MYHFNFIKYLPLILLIFLIAEAGNMCKAIDCPPEFDPDEWTEPTLVPFEPEPGDLSWGFVPIQTQNNNGVFEIVVDWDNISNSGRYGITNDEMREMLIRAIFAALGPDCPWDDPIQFKFHEKKICKVLRKCWLHVDYDRHFICADQGWPGPDPTLFEYSGEFYYSRAEEEECSYHCCEITYTVDCLYDSWTNQYVPKIISVSKNSYPDSECDPQTNYIDCLTQESVPCEGPCDE